MEIPVPRIPLGDWVEVVLDWLLATLGTFFTVILNLLETLYEFLLWLFIIPEWWIVTIVLAGLVCLLRICQVYLGVVYDLCGVSLLSSASSSGLLRCLRCHSSPSPF